MNARQRFVAAVWLLLASTALAGFSGLFALTGVALLRRTDPERHVGAVAFKMLGGPTWFRNPESRWSLSSGLFERRHASFRSVLPCGEQSTGKCTGRSVPVEERT